MQMTPTVYKPFLGTLQWFFRGFSGSISDTFAVVLWAFVVDSL